MNNTQRHWAGQDFNSWAQQKALDALLVQGRQLPCTVAMVSGPIVTVDFAISTNFTLPRVQVPIIGSEYVRLPIQVGCPGFVVATSARLGVVSGLTSAGAAAGLTAPSNLGSLAFVPIGNTNWTFVDGNALTLYGVDGVEIFDSAARKATVSLSSSGIVLSFGSSSVTINSSGVAIAGTLTINGMPYLTHTHTNGNEGSPTGPVIV